MKQRSLLLKTDSFDTRGSRLKKYSEKDHSGVGIFITVLAVVLDFALVFSRYDTITKESSILMLLATTLASVIVLDVPMYVAGCVKKERLQGLTSKKEVDIIIFGSLIAFGAIALLNLWLSIECRSFLLEDPGIASENSVFSEAHFTNSVLVGGLILGLNPILTSIATFVVGLYCSNPLLRIVNRIKKELNEIYSFLMQARRREAAISMSDPNMVFFAQKFLDIKEMLAKTDPADREQQLAIIKMLEEFVDLTRPAFINSSSFEYSVNMYKANIQNILAQEHMREQDTITALQRKLNTPDEISAVSRYAIDLAKDNAPQIIADKDISI